MLSEEINFRPEKSLALRMGPWAPTLAVVFVFAAIAAFDLSDGVLYLGDIDDRLRAIQIRQFLTGKGWYDLVLSGIAMPEPYVSPWSRMVDAPYAAFAWLLEPFVGVERGLSVAFHVWPPILMLMFAAFSVAAMRRLMPKGGRLEPLHAVTAALAMAYASLEFVPGRIDHHSVQLVTLAASCFGVLCWSRAGGILLAVSIVMSMTVGLETLPLITFLWGGLTLGWVMRRPGVDEIFQAFSLAIAIIAPAFTLLMAGPHVLFSVQNDIFSAPYVAAFAGFGLISFVAASRVPASAATTIRLASLALPAVLLLLIIAVTMPHVLAGPYAVVDALSRQLWLNRVGQEHSVLLLVRVGDSSAMASLALQAVIIVFALNLVWKEWRLGRTASAIVLLTGIGAFAANFLAYRFIRFPAALLPLFLPALLSQLSLAQRAFQIRVAASAIVIALTATVAFKVVADSMPVALEPGALEAPDFLMLDTCLPEDRAAIARLPKGRYMVTPAVGLTFLEMALAGVDVADISYHRASPGMRRMFEALYGMNAGERREALRPFDYVAFCSYPKAIRAMFTPPVGSLFAGLLADAPGPALRQLPVDGAPRLRLYRIEHSAL